MRTVEANEASETMRGLMDAKTFAFTVSADGAMRNETVAGFRNFSDAVDYAERLAPRIHAEGSKQTVNVWDERSNLRVHVIYSPTPLAA